MSLLFENKGIIIPEKHYVGFVPGGSLPKALMTEEGDKAVHKMRKGKVDYNCASSGIKSRIIENTPMLGFRITANHVSRYGVGRGETTWTIEDPRGFEMHISSFNLLELIQDVNIEQGEILEKCVWGKLSNSDILIPVSSSAYNNAVDNTVRFKQTTNVRTLKVGDRTLLKNGTEKIFIGKYYPITVRFGSTLNVVSSEKPLFVFTPDLDSKKLEVLKQPKVSKILENNVIDDSEIENMLQKHDNQIIGDYTDVGGSRNYTITSLISASIAELEKKITFESVDVDNIDSDDVFRYLLVKRQSDNTYFLGPINYNNMNHRIYLTELNTTLISSGRFDVVERYASNNLFSHRYSSTSCIEDADFSGYDVFRLVITFSKDGKVVHTLKV